MANDASSAFDEAKLDQLLQDPRFSRTFELAADETQGRSQPLRITYADYGYRNQENPHLEAVFLFFAPLLGSRMTRVVLDEIAKKHRVRIISPDRPGFGKTTDAKPECRIAFWRDATLALLKHLDIQHVSIGTQSGGTVYALDLILHHPEILHPERPYIAIGAPWIHPSQSGALAMSITESLPRVLIEQTDKLASLITTVSAPVISTSFGFSDIIFGFLGTKPSSSEVDQQVLFEDALQPRMIKFVYTEAVHGLSQEAVVLMKRTEPRGWSDWGDYDDLVPRLAELLRSRGQRLAVDVFLGETDFMIGDAGSKGPEWFDKCWKTVSDAQGSPIDYSSTVVKGADHNTTWNLQWGIPERVFKKLGAPVAP